METVYLAVVIVGCILGLGVWQTRQAGKVQAESDRRFTVWSKAVGESLKAPTGLERDLPGDLAERFASLERRMETLEQDALTYLRKGSQRYEMARRREKRLAESELDSELAGEEEGAEVEPTKWPQIEMPLGEGNHVRTPGQLDLADIRRRMFSERG